MNYKQIQQFLTIVKYMNLSAAAKELYISQPALSLSLGRMETTLGVKLFFRDGNRLILSPAGEKLLDIFQKLEQDFDELFRLASQVNDIEEQTIHIGFSCSAMLYAAIYFSDFLSEYKGKTIQKIHANSSQVLSLLKSEQIDFAITSPPLEDNAVSSMTIMTEPILLVVSSGHSLAGKTSVTFQELEGLDFVGIHKHNKFRTECDRLCKLNHFSPNYVIECEYPEQRLIISESAHSNRYVSFCARDSFEDYYGAGYVCIPIEAEHPMERITAISWLADKKLQYEYKDLIEYIIAKYDQLYRGHIQLIKSYSAT